MSAGCDGLDEADESRFPKYRPKNDKISLWTNSVHYLIKGMLDSCLHYSTQYGGYFGPATFFYFQKQNQKIKSGQLKGQMLHLDTLGTTNGATDMLYQIRSYPEFAYNNTYGKQWIPKAAYEESLQNLTKAGGCYDLIRQCRALATIGDAGFSNSNATVNLACARATQNCASNVIGAYDVYSGVCSPPARLTLQVLTISCRGVTSTLPNHYLSCTFLRRTHLVSSTVAGFKRQWVYR
jgi:hypothetical protein